MSRSQIPAKIILGVFIVVFIIFIADSIRKQTQIKVFVPYGLIAVFISFYTFRNYNRVKREKRENRSEYMNERRQELLNDIFKKNKETSQKGD
jgi:hypothetical protein